MIKTAVCVASWGSKENEFVTDQLMRRQWNRWAVRTLFNKILCSECKPFFEIRKCEICHEFGQCCNEIRTILCELWPAL